MKGNKKILPNNHTAAYTSGLSILCQKKRRNGKNAVSLVIITKRWRLDETKVLKAPLKLQLGSIPTYQFKAHQQSFQSINFFSQFSYQFYICILKHWDKDPRKTILKKFQLKKVMQSQKEMKTGKLTTTLLCYRLGVGGSHLCNSTNIKDKDRVNMHCHSHSKRIKMEMEGIDMKNV